MASVRNGVVTVVVGHRDTLAHLARENIILAIAAVVDVLRAHQGTHAAVVVVLLQLRPLVRLVVIQVQQVVRRATLVLLARVEVIALRLQNLLLLHFSSLHVFEALDFPVEPLVAQVGQLVLDVFVLAGADALLRDSEVLIEAFLLCPRIDHSAQGGVELLAYRRCSGRRSGRGCAPPPRPRTYGNRLCVRAAASSQSAPCLSAQPATVQSTRLARRSDSSLACERGDGPCPGTYALGAGARLDIVEHGFSLLHFALSSSNDLFCN